MSVSTYEIASETILHNCLSEIAKRSETQKLRVRIDEKKHPKSDRQLGYVWACAYPTIKGFLDHNTGQSFNIDNEIHPYHTEVFADDKTQSLRRELDLGAGPKIISTRMSRWNAKPMGDYINWLLPFYAERGLFIPEPDPYWKSRGIKN